MYEPTAEHLPLTQSMFLAPLGELYAQNPVIAFLCVLNKLTSSCGIHPTVILSGYTKLVYFMAILDLLHMNPLVVCFLYFSDIVLKI